ncbi:hypothetical protein CEXT_587251 [Caerostris extrusa]|uniref:Uncharacterized protein n=1 Tax=Caerostris extrusa TaxID=172846 RepID=A0AAV4RIL0_CAEEX|nr:hypothetical protein CEXT_587251 [Caerostris extrusa]
MFTSEVSMTSSDKKEFQPVVEKSDLFESHEIEIYPPLIKNTAAEEINTSEVSSSLTFNNVENIEIISNNSDCNPNTDLNSETVKTISVGNEEVLSVEVDSESYNSHLQEKDEINSINQEKQYY